MAHFVEAARAGAAVALAASVFHFGTITIPTLKAFLQREGISLFQPPAP
jgi:cyclase